MKRTSTYLLAAACTLVIACACGLIGLYLWASDDLPSITRVDDYRAPQVTTVYARDRSVIGYLFRE
jgi:penicillin-binding protein 1A